MTMDNRQIAKFLRECANSAPNEYTDDFATFTVPGTRLRLKCRNSRDHIRSMADRFEKGVPRGGCTGPLKVASRPMRATKCDFRVFNRFWDDGERGNAMEYLRLFPRETWPERILDRIEAASSDEAPTK